MRLRSGASVSTTSATRSVRPTTTRTTNLSKRVTTNQQPKSSSTRSNKKRALDINKSVSSSSSQSNANKRQRSLQPPKHTISFHSLPSEVIDIIVFYLIPTTSTREEPDAIAHSLLPLALTSKSMLTKVATALAPYIQNRLIFPNCKGYPGTTSSDYFLFHTASIILNQKKLSNSLAQVSTRVRTRSMTSAGYSDIKLIPSIFPNNLDPACASCCNSAAPLFDADGHCPQCRRQMAWLTIAANTGQFSNLQLNLFHDDFDEERPQCILRLARTLKLPLKKLTLKDLRFTKRCEGGNVLRDFINDISDSLNELHMVPASYPLIKIVCRISFPNLKSISFINEFYDWSSLRLRKRPSKVLSSLQKHGSALNSVSIRDEWFSVRSQAYDMLDLNNLAPTVRHLKIVRFSQDSNETLEKSFKLCSNVEVLEFCGGYVDFDMLVAARVQGVLPNLKKIIFKKMTSVRFPKLVDMSCAIVEMARMISELDQIGYIDRDILQARIDHFPFIPAITLRIRSDDIPDVCSLVQNSTDLKRLTVLREDMVDVYLDGIDRKVVYSKDLIDKIMQHCSSMESLIICGCCATVDEGLAILRKMGKSAKVFRLPLCPANHSSPAIRELPKCDDVIKLLETVVEYCPSMEKFYISLDHEGHDFGWTWEDTKIIEKAVMSAARRSKKLDASTFFQDPGRQNCDYDDIS